MSADHRTKPQLLADLAALRAEVAQVSAKHAAEAEQARDVAHAFHSLFEEAPIAYHELDGEGRILRVNQAELEMLGYSAAEMLGHFVWEFIGEGEASRASVLAKLAGTKPAGHKTERTYARKNGTPIPVMCEDRLVRDSEGRVVGIRTAILDISDKKAAEEASDKLAALVAQLEEQNSQNTILNEMREFLLACSATSEIGPVATRTMARLFPGSAGALMLLSPSRTDLETVSRWGEFPDGVDQNIFPPDACWGLRRGGNHAVDDADSGVICQHVKQVPALGYVCLPLTAKGDVLGLLHIRRHAPPPGVLSVSPLARVHELAATVSGILSLSIWNMRLRETLANQAIKDPLTGLFNRAFMEDALQREIHRAGRRKTQLAVIMADIDGFKKFNDQHGHAAGDLVLREIANYLKWKVRAGDVVCRYGGEEFALILPESTIEGAAARADALRDGAKGIRTSYGGQALGPVTLSMGVSMYPECGAMPQDLLHAADAALYKAKQAGRDCVVVAEPQPAAETD
jgi:diguanylate cyclase (GGDEF)-like protein/PAS domain S-box-containing protein